jgi:hypothetical protein
MSLFLGPIADVEALLIGLLCRYSLKLEYFFVPSSCPTWTTAVRNCCHPPSWSRFFFRHSFIKCPVFPQSKHVFPPCFVMGLFPNVPCFRLLFCHFGFFGCQLFRLVDSNATVFGLVPVTFSRLASYAFVEYRILSWSSAFSTMESHLSSSIRSSRLICGSTALLRIRCIASNSF